LEAMQLDDNCLMEVLEVEEERVQVAELVVVA
jgi:hypothetical protein